LNTPDQVNSPDHYTHGGIETWDYVLAKQGVRGTLWYCMGNVLKYVSRAPYKGKELEDLKKAQWYINRMVELVEKDKHDL
jgi:hypothetical protein